MKTALEKSIVLFDGICNLCNTSINRVLRNDPKDRFRFAPLQSDYAKNLLKSYSTPIDQLSSVVLIENGKIYQRSTAALRIAKQMGAAYPLLYTFIIVPAFLRDLVYDYIARNRYRWWGKRESCMISTVEVQQKFLT